MRAVNRRRCSVDVACLRIKFDKDLWCIWIRQVTDSCSSKDSPRCAAAAPVLTGCEANLRLECVSAASALQERSRDSSDVQRAKINPAAAAFDVRQMHNGGNTAATTTCLNSATANISPALSGRSVHAERAAYGNPLKLCIISSIPLTSTPQMNWPILPGTLLMIIRPLQLGTLKITEYFLLLPVCRRHHALFYNAKDGNSKNFAQIWLTRQQSRLPINKVSSSNLLGV